MRPTRRLSSDMLGVPFTHSDASLKADRELMDYRPIERGNINSIDSLPRCHHP